MIILNRHFKPGRFAVALLVVAMTLFISLGTWQLDRAAFKSAVKLKYESRLKSAYAYFDASDYLADIEYRKLILKGAYDNSKSLLIDNKVFNGRIGYHVLTPFALRDSDYIVLINRGWVALGVSRDTLPEIQLPGTRGELRGIASLPTTEGFRMGQVSLQDDWPQVIPYLDIDALQSAYANRLLPMVLWLSPDEQGSYERDWNPVWADPEKSKAYAWQWFGFALLAAMLFVILNLRKIE